MEGDMKLIEDHYHFGHKNRQLPTVTGDLASIFWDFLSEVLYRITWPHLSESCWVISQNRCRVNVGLSFSSFLSFSANTCRHALYNTWRVLNNKKRLTCSSCGCALDLPGPAMAFNRIHLNQQCDIEGQMRIFWESCCNPYILLGVGPFNFEAFSSDSE